MIGQSSNGNRGGGLRAISISALSRRISLAAHHEVYVIDRDKETKRLSFKKIMDARYA